MSLAMPMQAFTRSHYGDRSYSSFQSVLNDAGQLVRPLSPADRPIPKDLDILSAAQYPHGLMQPYEDVNPNPRKRKATTSTDQYYGGIVLSAAATVGESNHSSSAEQESLVNQKKARFSKRASTSEIQDQEADKKQRGRPRLDTQDETAADRRRTQIRLAQRAYRHRKETTISGLKSKVSDLQNTIEQMNKIFLTLHDNMVDAGILNSHYSLSRQLQAATEEFVTLSKVASPDSDEEEEAAIAALTKGETLEVSEAGEKRTSKRGGARQDAKSSSSRASTKKANACRSVSFNNNVDQYSSTDMDADMEELPSTLDRQDESTLGLTQTTWMADNSNIHGLNDLLAFNATVPEVILNSDANEDLIIERPLKSPYQPQGSYTYSFQETTFARRLHRMCLERAFRNLTNPQIDPNYVKRAFRFTFCFSNRKRILNRFQEMLKRKAGEALENWNVPFFHIGGAGTHFPRRDGEGKPIFPPNLVSPAKALCPQPYIEVETPRPEANVQEMLDNIGFGGIWFDSHDVEQYLKTKGIFLDGQSSFIEVDPTVLAMMRSSISSLSDATSSSDRSPLEALLRTPSPTIPVEQFTHSVTDPYLVHELSELYAQPSTLFPPSNTNTTTTNSLAPLQPSKLDELWPEFGLSSTMLLSTGTSPLPQFNDFLGGDDHNNAARNSLTFDVEMFLERMIQGSACLGRAPGFRKETIDRALMTSLQESF